MDTTIITVLCLRAISGWWDINGYYNNHSIMPKSYNNHSEFWSKCKNWSNQSGPMQINEQHTILVWYDTAVHTPNDMDKTFADAKYMVIKHLLT